MRWDIVLFLKGYPARYRFGDAHYFMLAVRTEKLEELSELSKARLPDSAPFFDAARADQFTAFGIRVDADDQQAAIDLAHDCLNGFIDGASLILGHELPRQGPLAIIREGSDDDSSVVLLVGPQWTYMNPPGGSSSSWEAQSAQIFKELWPFFDVVAQVHARRDTDLAKQLLYSIKMYRHGVSAAMEGVEFICKWSALEGLVSAGARLKRETLVSRLRALFVARSEEMTTIVNGLWKARNDAVHEARAFRSAQLKESSPLAGPIQQTDELFLGVAIFAISHLDKAESLDALWSLAPAFEVPSFARQTRPGRFRIMGGTMPVARGLREGKYLDTLFAPGAREM